MASKLDEHEINLQINEVKSGIALLQRQIDNLQNNIKRAEGKMPQQIFKLPNDEPEEVEVKVSDVMCDNALVLGDNHYRKVNDIHQATKVIEEGCYCIFCGDKVRKVSPSMWLNKDGTEHYCFICRKRDYRGISY
jgi:hypothetical protein